MEFQDLAFENWAALVAIALAFAWVASIFAYVLAHWFTDKTMNRMMGEFARNFPHRCFLCSYYRGVMQELPPDHKCDDWTAEP